MSREESLELEGKVVEVLPNANFRVILLNEKYNRREIIAIGGGRMQQNKIRIIPGDLVTVVITLKDLTKGRITRRHK